MYKEMKNMEYKITPNSNGSFPVHMGQISFDISNKGFIKEEDNMKANNINRVITDVKVID